MAESGNVGDRDFKNFKKLPPQLQKMIFHQHQKMKTCDEITADGKRCGEAFKYSIQDKLYSKEETKKIIRDCTKFCLKHLSDLIINGEALIGYETEDGKKNIIKARKLNFAISAVNSNTKLSLNYDFSERDEKLIGVNFSFPSNKINYEELESKINKSIGSPEPLSKFMRDKIDLNFKGGIISKFWRKFIIDMFKENKYQFKLRFLLLYEGENQEELLNSRNRIISLGNLSSIEIIHLFQHEKYNHQKYVQILGDKIISH